ncbi:Arylamine N-acetyltransferase [Baekduia alba]|uniref:arylamine N-acetyltransferase family protein n=1 Tax=Baekduia alba TaxID=2997333 RepID=UPI002341AAFC|nr:arylamine N-acetyltransferase [Baekduia alba]WCB96771.1 Arylamine N-acetyltransferase [Baekduia alba]
MIDELLKHIGLDHRPGSDAPGLREVHRAFVSRLAYDGITAQLGEHAELDPDRLILRTLTTGRGGYCFEINTILLTLLRALCFGVERREALVDEREAHAGGAPINHLALVATTADGERFLCDAGWGEGPLEPVPLRAGAHVRGPFSWVLEREPQDDGWWITQHRWGSTPGFRFGDDAVPLATYAPHHLRLATSADSSFVKTLVVQQPHDDEVVTLRGRTLSRKGPRRDERAVLDDEDALAATLRDVFGIDPAALGTERVARLWANACAQHEAFVRTACSPASAPPEPPRPA